MPNRQELALIARSYGVVLPPSVTQYIPEHLANDSDLAMDALPALVTVSNSGIPSFLTNFVDPKFIEILTTPNKAAVIMGETKKGDWTTPTAFFPVIESAGEVSSYGDYAKNGRVTANVNWPQRQSYHYQTVTQWGEKELAMMGVGKINWSNQLNAASAKVMDKFANKMAFFGIAGLQNYGLLNDPNLVAAIAPLTKAAGGVTWAAGTANELFEDVKALFKQAVSQTGGILEKEDGMQLCLSPDKATDLLKLSPFNVSVEDMLKKAFPKMRITTAVEYATVSGQLMQLIVDSLDGQEVVTSAFTEKMRAHSVKVELSSYEQKKSGGGWGAIIFAPMGIAQMIGL